MKGKLSYLQAVLSVAVGTCSIAAEAKRGVYDIIVQRDVMVEMRDGVRLATDIYYPARDGEPIDGEFPALLLRTACNGWAYGSWVTAK